MAATYCVTFSEEDWGETADHVPTRAEGDQRLASAQAAGKFARLIRWQNNQSLEVKRVNPNAAEK